MTKKDEYIEARDTVINCLDELKQLLKEDTPLRREKRKAFMEKFIQLDRQLIDKLDRAAHEYSKEIDD